LYLIDPRGRIQLSDLDVIKRHLEYAKQLHLAAQNEGKTARLVVLTCSKRNNLKTQYFDVEGIAEKKSQFFNFTKRAFVEISKQSDSNFALIAGDPWLSACAALLIRRRFKRQVNLQVQVHFDVRDLNLKRWTSLSSLIRWEVFKFTTRRANQIRVVNEADVHPLITLLKSECNIFHAPSLLKRQPFSLSRNNSKDTTLGFVGRLHRERSPEDFIRLVKRLKECEHAFRVVVIGDGPQKNFLSTELGKILNPDQLEFLGFLSGQEYWEALSRIDVLISTAKSESYGRVLREALIAGSRVLAVPTSGLESLINDFGGPWIELLNPNFDGLEICTILHRLKRTDVPKSLGEKFEEMDKFACSKLAESWLELLFKV
jgi:glycosyltransferase involved in cell wall biosynthesis